MVGEPRLTPTVRLALERRCAGACETCRLEWRWALFVFKIEADRPATTDNLIVFCGCEARARTARHQISKVPVVLVSSRRFAE